MVKSGLLVFVLGFGMVFVVLALLIFMIRLISLVTDQINKLKPAKEVPELAPAPAASLPAGQDLTPEALAAITAALAQALNKDVGQLIIRDVKRV